MFDLDFFLRRAYEAGASDLHLEEGSQPAVRINGEINFLDMPELNVDDIDDMCSKIFQGDDYETFINRGDVDLSYDIPGLCRFRVNALNHYGGRGAVFRIIPNEIPTVRGMGLPPALEYIAESAKGLVLVTGPTGSGKSTTLAAMLDHINSTRAAHIITIEDPIEFLHPPKKSYVEQRQVGLHASSFGEALYAGLRESPDVIMVGEMRDMYTIRQALRAAETGHLVLATLHTSSVAQTTSRLIDVFPAEEQNQVRSMLSSVLRAIISQQLLPKRRGGRVAAMEILINNNSISSMLREGRTNQLRTFIMMGRDEGMQTLDHHLAALVASKTIDIDVAYEYVVDRDILDHADDIIY